MVKPLPPKRSLDDVASFIVTGKAGDVLFSQGDEGSDLYLIDEGEVELLVDDRVVRRLSAGDFFGERSMLARRPREATARAATTCRLLKLDSDTVEQLVSEAPEIGLLMLTRLSGQLHEIAARPPAGAVAPAAEPVAPPAFAAAPPPETPVDAPSQGAAKPAPAPAGEAVLEHAESGTVFPLADKPELLVGRLDRASGIVPDIDFTTLDRDKTIGRRHAMLVRRDHRFFVREDKATSNGTFVNGVRIAPQSDVAVDAGDTLRFGVIETTLRFR
jgi:hypothetical protein